MNRNLKIITLLACMIFSLFANAQKMGSLPTSYNPILSEGKCWTMRYKAVLAPWAGDVYTYKETKIEDETVIGGIRFMREYEKIWTPRRGEQKPEEWTATNRYLGEDGSKVYLCDGTEESIRPIIDFSLGENEIFPMHGEDGAIVTAVSDTILANSTDKVPRKCMHLSLVGIEVDVWVEGIGSLDYGLDGLDIERIGAIPMLEKCVEGDNIIYQLDGDINGMNNIEISFPHDAPFFDLQGRRLTDTPHRGMYIRDGKKYVVK